MKVSRNTYDAFKRAFDLAFSGVGLILTAPVQLLVALLVLTTSGRPILFRQERPGKNGKIFEMVKFRTMLPLTAERATDELRLTRTGKLIRASSLDELPTLWNVFKGDMSLVGPRPLLVEYLPLYTSEQSRRHEVRPGITGLAQTSGRNSLTWQERFQYDVEYVDNRSFVLDLKILWGTLKTVLAREGISHDGHATMPRFGEQDSHE
ncbi:sugar transferase [Corynebacterium sp. H127]|uniref:sugar transferase n=1 Tax=Corynebacterium sp. H127 TaxID=3133418 RepID=UPI0030995061